MCLEGDLFRIQRQHSPHLGVLPSPIYQTTQKAASFERIPGQEKALLQVQFAGPPNPAYPKVQKVPVAGGDDV